MTSAENPDGMASQPLTAALPACHRSFSLFSAIPRPFGCHSVSPFWCAPSHRTGIGQLSKASAWATGAVPPIPSQASPRRTAAPLHLRSPPRHAAPSKGKTGMNDPVDVLIIGAGASGAAVAWSLADTKMHILCVEQGGWMNPAAYPSAGRDWEARAFGDYSPSPNIRARPEDYPINADASPIKIVNFNGVGGSTVMYTAHWPRLHPSDFKVKTLDGVADACPI